MKNPWPATALEDVDVSPVEMPAPPLEPAEPVVSWMLVVDGFVTVTVFVPLDPQAARPSVSQTATAIILSTRLIGAGRLLVFTGRRGGGVACMA
jgi:hypothetical protein